MQNEWPKRLSALLGTSLIVPIIGEFAVAMINNEPFNPDLSRSWRPDG